MLVVACFHIFHVSISDKMKDSQQFQPAQCFVEPFRDMASISHHSTYQAMLLTISQELYAEEYCTTFQTGGHTCRDPHKGSPVCRSTPSMTLASISRVAHAQYVISSLVSSFTSNCAALDSTSAISMSPCHPPRSMCTSHWMFETGEYRGT